MTPQGTLDEVSVFGFKDGQAGIEQVTLGYYDDVKPLRDLVATKNLSNQTFGAISLDRAAELPGRRDAQPADAGGIGEGEHRAEPPVNLHAAVVDLLIFDASANAFGG